MSYDPFDTSIDQTRAEAQEAAKLREKIAVEDLKWIMSDRRGRRFVYNTLERCGALRLSFDTNALRMAFNEGRRDVGLPLIARLQMHCPGNYQAMLKEGNDD